MPATIAAHQREGDDIGIIGDDIHQPSIFPR